MCCLPRLRITWIICPPYMVESDKHASRRLWWGTYAPVMHLTQDGQLCSVALHRALTTCCITRFLAQLQMISLPFLYGEIWQACLQEGVMGVHKNIASVCDIHGVTINLDDVPISGKRKLFFFLFFLRSYWPARSLFKLSSSVDLWASVARWNDELLTNSPMATAPHRDRGYHCEKGKDSGQRDWTVGALLF